jgi:hypothetical protein
MLAIQILKAYNDEEVVSVIESKITDRNWYVRINALEYLVANGLDNDDIKEIIELNDKYAMETLLYLFKNDEEKSALISKVLEKTEKTVEEGVTV